MAMPGTLRGLGWMLGIPAERLRFYSKTVGRHYSEFPVPKPYGFRMIHKPSAGLKEIQQRIYREILLPVQLPESVHGGVRGRSPRTNAEQHLRQRNLIRLDVKECFPSIKPRLVYRLFTAHLGFSPDVASVLTKLTTFDRELPQGVSTSTAIANLIIAYECEREFSAAAIRYDLKATRFVDDLFFSGEHPEQIIKDVVSGLRRIGLKVSRDKLAIMRSGCGKEVTGLTVNRRSSPSVAQRKQAQIRAAIFQLDVASSDFVRERQSILGRIAYVRQTNSGAADRLQRYLDSRLP